MQDIGGERDRANQRELVARLAAAVREDGAVEPLAGLRLARASQPSALIHGVSEPSVCVIAQGAKEVYLGASRYRYDADHYLLATVGLPVSGRVCEATAECPYLALRLQLDRAVVGSVMVEAALPPPRNQGDARAVVVSPLDPGLRDAMVRLLRLIESPEEARVLLPLLQREIIFRLLAGEQGNRLRHLPTFGGHSHSIAQAVDLLRRDYAQPLRIESLARELGMSLSGFHHHFRAVTEMSPLQFQKQLRLQEARRLMLSEEADVTTAGLKVGYYDASHFSRDYKRHFGVPPARDVERLRVSLEAAASADTGTP